MSITLPTPDNPKDIPQSALDDFVKVRQLYMRAIYPHRYVKPDKKKKVGRKTTKPPELAHLTQVEWNKVNRNNFYKNQRRKAKELKLKQQQEQQQLS